MKKILILASFLFLINTSGSTQKYYELEEMFLDADSWFFYEDYREALPLFQRVLAAEPLNYNVMYKIGFCYLHIPGQKTKSIPYLEKAAENYTLRYRNNSFSETEAPPDALFYLGNAYLINNQMDKALDAYEAFQNKILQNKKFVNKDIYDIDYVQKQINACKNALKFQDNPVGFISSNIGSNINTRFSEYNPAISGDGSTLIFTASLQFYDAIFFSKKKDGKWSYPINLMPQLGIDDNTTTLALSYDGTELYLYRDDDFIGNVFVSFFRNGSWTKIKKLNENINTKYWEAHASLSADGNELYFVSNREDGFGDLDIYVSERLTDTTWGEPINLGNRINTQWNENTPFITSDGSKLFFSSEGHTNMGGYDIFYSEKINGQWSKPVNIGYPINTTDDDLFFVPYENGKFAFSSEYSDYGYGGADIFLYQLFHIPENSNIKVEGILTMDNPRDRNKENFTIYVTEYDSQDTIAVLYPDKDGEDYKYKTTQGKNHLVWEGKSEQGNQYSISQEYKIKEAFLEPIEFKETKKLALEDSGPEIELESFNYVVMSDQKNVKIKLSLKKGNKLFVNTYYKDKLINSEEFDIRKNKFVYEYKPLKGESKIEFRLADKNNNVKTEEVTVSYIPLDTEAELAIIEQIADLSSGNKNVKVKLAVEKNSKLFVESYADNKLINKESFDIKKEEFTYEYESKGDKTRILFKLVDKQQNFKNEELLISHKPLSNDFAKLLASMNSFDSKIFNQIIDPDELSKINTVSELIAKIYSQAAAAGLSEQQAKALIIALALNSTNKTSDFIAGLAELASGDIKLVLDSAIQNNFQFNTNLEIIEYLKKESENYDYTIKDIADLLEKYLTNSDFEVHYLVSILGKLIDLDFNNILSNMDISALDIITTDDFKKYLEQQNIYTKDQLNQIYALIEGLILSGAVEQEKPVKEDVTKEKLEKDRGVLIISIIICFIILGLIIIFFNRRKKKRNRNR